MLDYTETLQRAQARYLATLGPDAQVFCLLGRERRYAKSAYKAFVRRTPRSRWHVFDQGAGRPVQTDPIAAHARMVQRSGRGTVKAALVRLDELTAYEFHPDRRSLAALWARAMELS